MPSLFDTFTLKGTILRNRICASPMCQYAAEDGVAGAWHHSHLAGLARGGAALVVIEATAVSPEGRISIGDLGLWNDRQAEALTPIIAEIKRYGAVPGIQLNHAGRKASAKKPWEGGAHLATDDPLAWEPIAASAIPQGASLSRMPRAMTIDDIRRVQQDFVAAAERARDIGIAWLSFHFGHGYLAQNFLSPHSNTRSDAYGGSAENRGRFLVETIRGVRRVWPEERPLTARLGVVDFDARDEEALAEAVALARQFKNDGLDMIDVSAGFSHDDTKPPWGPGFMVPFAEHIRRETGLPGSASWYISDPHQAERYIAEERIDLVMLARPLLANPHWPFAAAKALGIPAAARSTLPMPYAYWLERYRENAPQHPRIEAG